MQVLTPVYNMKTGYRDGAGVPFQLPSRVDKSLLIIEGIHALNPNFLESVPAQRIFKVCIPTGTPMPTPALPRSRPHPTRAHRAGIHLAALVSSA